MFILFLHPLPTLREMGLANEGTSVSHRPCHAGMATTAAPRASTAVLTGGPASKDQVSQMGST